VERSELTGGGLKTSFYPFSRQINFFKKLINLKLKVIE
jgi:hypothetical protein